MSNKNNITGIILAGGKSTRMGSDKGFVTYQNKPFIQHIIDTLQPLVSEIIIVSNNPDYDVFKLKRIDDVIKDAGPLAGIYTGLHHSKTEKNLVLSCDIPAINQDVLKQLILQKNEEIDVVQVESKGKTMPLIALYNKRCASTCLALLESGERRLRFLIKQLKSKTIVLDDTLEKYTANINSQSDLKQLNNEFKH